MPTYNPNPADTSTPQDSAYVLDLPAEIRALKARVNELTGTPAPLINPLRKNLLDNGTFQIAQRRSAAVIGASVTFAPNVRYFYVDRWPFYNAGGSNFTAVLENGQIVSAKAGVSSRSFALYTTTPGINARIAQFQRISNVRNLAGKTLTLSLKLTIPAAVIAAGTVTVDVQLFYGTGGTPAATIFLLPVTQVTTSAAEEITYSWTFTVPNDAETDFGTSGDEYIQVRLTHQLITGEKLIWFGAQLEQGDVATPIESLRYIDEFWYCAMHFQTSYTRGQLIGAAATLNGSESFTAANSDSTQYRAVAFLTPMIGVPVVTLYSPQTANAPGKVYKETATAGDISGCTAQRISNRGFATIAMSAAISGHNYSFHWTADAENYQ